MAKQVKATITVTETGWFDLEENESPQEFENRVADIYLWGANDNHSDKVDIGGSTSIEILETK